MRHALPRVTSPVTRTKHAEKGRQPRMTVYTGSDGITHVRFADGTHYAGRNGNYTKVSS